MEIERTKLDCARVQCEYLQQALDDYKRNIDSTNLIKHSIKCLNELLNEIVKQ